MAQTTRDSRVPLFEQRPEPPLAPRDQFYDHEKELQRDRQNRLVINVVSIFFLAVTAWSLVIAILHPVELDDFHFLKKIVSL